MTKTRNRLYGMVLLGCSFAYLLVYWTANAPESSFSVCLFKKATGLPCPSCGSTRAIVSMAKGHFLQALLYNPIGVFLGFLLILLPLWALIDLLLGRQSLFFQYQQANTRLKNPKILVPFLLLIAVNWIWNITKGL